MNQQIQQQPVGQPVQPGAAQPQQPAGAQQQQQQNAEAERQKKYDECQDLLMHYDNELQQVIEDLAEARCNKQPTGPLYTEKQRIEDEMVRVRSEMEKWKPVAPPAPAKPDMAEHQVSIGGGAVGRYENLASTSILTVGRMEDPAKNPVNKKP